MEPAVLVALVSVATAVVTTAGGVIVAIVTNHREAQNAADKTLDATVQERIVLRDEQIAALERKLQNRDDKIARLELELERYVVTEAQALTEEHPHAEQ